MGQPGKKSYPQAATRLHGCSCGLVPCGVLLLRRMRGSNARGVMPRRRLSKPLPYHSANPPGRWPRAMRVNGHPGGPAARGPRVARCGYCGSGGGPPCRELDGLGLPVIAALLSRSLACHAPCHHCAVNRRPGPLIFRAPARGSSVQLLICFSRACGGADPAHCGRLHPSARRAGRRPGRHPTAGHSWR